MKQFKKGDKVKVINPALARNGQSGVVEGYTSEGVYSIRIDNIILAFGWMELELVLPAGPVVAPPLPSIPDLTKRDLFAALFMHGVVVNGVAISNADAVRASTEMADALIAELEK